MNGAGAPMAQAAIQAYGGLASGCHFSQTDFGGVLSAEDGSYRIDMAHLGAQDSVCVFTFARPPEGSTSLANSDTVLVVLDFRLEPPHDSTRIDLTLHVKVE